MTLTGAPLLVALTGLAVTALLATAGLRRLRWRALTAGVCLLSCTLAAAAAENDQFGYDRSWSALLGTEPEPDLLPSLHLHLAPVPPAGGFSWPTLAASRPRHRTHGTLLAVDFAGPTSRINRSGYVYLPPQYLQPAYAARTFPVLELISGSPGAPQNWVRQMDIAQQMDRLIASGTSPMILVIPAPNSHFSQSEECVNAVGGAQDDTYLTNDVRTDVIASFRADPSRNSWGLAGYSTGGFCAVNLLTRHSDLYSAAASMDGYFHALSDHYTGDLYHGDTAARLANSPDWVWSQRPPAAHVAMLLLAGGDDASATTATVQFHDQMVSGPSVIRGGDTVTEAIRPNAGHSFVSWRAELPSVLIWAAQQLAAPAALSQGALTAGN